MSNDYSNLKRELKGRNLTMMALGGTIGTGLFLASGSVIHTAGPGGAILGYLLVGLLVYFVMTSLGELGAYLPITGSFCDYSTRFVDEAFGFAMSWNYWLNWGLVVASEIIAAGVIMQYWFPNGSPWLWSSIFFIVIVLLNIVGVKLYGEAEYWLSFIKLSTVVIFIIVGFLTIFGLNGHHGPVGFHNITIGDAPFHGGWVGFLTAFFVIGYTFQGVELVGVAVGEAKNPKENFGKAVRRIFWRILLFYVLAIIVISFLIPYTSDLLVNANAKISASPFTLVFQAAGFKYAASIMNLVIITAIISTANASLYTTSRVLWHIGNTNAGPKFFATAKKRGIPLVAILISAIFAGLFVISSIFGHGVIFTWLLNIIGLVGYIAWFGICLSHYRFRRAYHLQGKSINDLPFLAKWFPLAPIFAMGLILIIILGQEAMAVISGQASWIQFAATYCGLVIFAALYFGYKWIKKTKIIPLKDISLEEIHINQ